MIIIGVNRGVPNRKHSFSILRIAEERRRSVVSLQRSSGRARLAGGPGPSARLRRGLGPH